MAKKPVPALCFHKSLRLGYVTDPITKREHYFSAAWGRGDPSPALREEYRAWVAKLILRRKDPAASLDPKKTNSIARLLNAFLTWSIGYYRRQDGSVTGEPACIKNAIEYVLRIDGNATMAVDEFGPLALKQVRQSMIDAGQSRKWINDQMHRIRRAFRWGVENELVKVETLERLKAVTALARGRSPATEQRPVLPVSFQAVEKTIAQMKPLYQALVRFHLHSGCRAEEALSVRPCDIDRTTTPWVYRPSQHKTAHLGIAKEIYLGPKARAAVEPLLAEARADKPLFASRGRGKRHAYRGPLTISGYRSKIEVACKRAGVAVWLPRQLRHSQLTHVRKSHPKGIEAAQVIAGHSELNTTEIYAEQDRELGRDAAEKFG